MSQTNSLVDFYVNALQTTLGRTLRQRGAEQAALIRRLREKMMQGYHEGTKQVLDILTSQIDLPFDQRQSLVAGVLKLAEFTPELLTDAVDSNTLKKSIEEMYALALLVEKIGQPDMAYNLFEGAYHLASVLGDPSLKVAINLRRLANPDNVNQYHAAIWRFATAKLGDCVKAYKSRAATLPPTNEDWLSALDAVELAFNVCVDLIPLQQQLCDQFVQVLREAEGTPVEELVAIYPVQVDAQYIDPEKRGKLIAALTGSPAGSNDTPSRIAALELWAAVKGQTMLDDVRLKFLNRYRGRPNLSWHDLTLQHENLLHAVPLQRALIVDIDRTGELILELTHEIAHAYCLLGPIGWAITAFRVATHCCELIITSPDVKENSENKRTDGLANLQDDAALIDFAEIQLAACYRSAVHEAIWTPWLEGVAQYVEMLADPKADPQEIMTVHEAVRSLVDLSVDPLGGESQEDFAQRYSDELSKQFEDFLSDALSRYARFRHVGYLQEKARREVYLFGYLLVRSIVARWEVTLGRRIEPVLAAKLLLNASRNGTYSIAESLQREPEEFSSCASAIFSDWIETLATIDRESLEAFFESVASDALGHKYYWKGGRPRRVADHVDDAQATVNSSWTTFEQACTGLVSGTGLRHAPSALDIAGTVATEHHKLISQLFEHYLETMSLLPVGKDMSRLVLFDDGRAMVCPRTYVGLEEPREDGSLPRYSPRVFPLTGGATETDFLRRSCGLLGTARLHVTRIIDLTGHANSPNQRPNISYVCLFLGDKWHRVTLGDTHVTNGIGDDFIEALRRRVLHPPFPNEVGSLRSPLTLAKRLVERKAHSHYAALALAFNKDALSFDVALRAAARAFGSNEHELRDASSLTLAATKGRVDLADYLALTGKGQVTRNHPALGTPLASIALRTESMSGITPFGGSHG